MMKKILLVYLPFCTPASSPYSITYLYSFLKHNCHEEITVLDLNLEFHKLKFPQYQRYYHDNTQWNNYEDITTAYHHETEKIYAENNKKVVHGEKPELFYELLQKIINKKPDIVAFSIVYSSQAFYAYALLKELKKHKEIATVIGGPACNEKLAALAGKSLANEIKFLNYIEEKTIDHDALQLNFPLDFSIYPLNDYFTPHPVIPLKTSTTCYYKQCTFCTHYSKVPYAELSLNNIKQTIVLSQQKHFFIIDDMISSQRLLRLAEMLKPLQVSWMCQLRPTRDFTFDLLKTCYEAGLRMVIWGVESGSQRILDLMKKGTMVDDVAKVLQNANKAGIKNGAYIMFGFPTETKEEFLDTINFLKKNEHAVDLILRSVFGLQKGAPAYNNPQAFGIGQIIEEQRTVLPPKIRYSMKDEQSQLAMSEINKLNKQYGQLVDNINKYPKSMNFFREHMLALL